MKNIAWLILSVVGTCFIGSTSVLAQSNPLYFPYVVNDSQTSTDLILTNLAASDATVNLVAYTEDGSVAGNQISLVVPAGSQTIVGGNAFDGLHGWVLGSSSVSGVNGNVRVASRDATALDIGETTSPDSVIVLPFIAQSSGSSTEISIANPTLASGRVTLTIYDKDGNTVAAKDSSLAPFGVLRGSLSALFGSGVDYSRATHIVARSGALNILSMPITIVGFEVVRNFTRIPSDPSLEKISTRTDWATLPAVPASTTSNSITFPQVNRGAGWFSLIGLVNVASSAQAVTLTYSSPGKPDTATSVFVPANGSLRLTAVDLFGQGLDAGSVTAFGSSSLAGFVATGTQSGSALASALGQARGKTAFFFPSVDETGASFTGIVVQNSANVQAQVNLFLLSSSGETKGATTVLLSPGQRSVKLVRDYFTEGLNQSGGYIFVNSSAPIVATEVVGTPDKVLSEFSTQGSASGFVPPPQVRFAIRGRVTDNGLGTPVRNLNIVLSKTAAADVISVTDNNGQFLFTNLFPGDYTVKPVQAGEMFAPISSPVRIDTQSVTLNFTCGTLPRIASVTVVSNDSDTQQTAGNNPNPFAIFGTSEVSLKIQGANFLPASSGQSQPVFFGTVQIPTQNVNFIDDKTVFVKLVLSAPDIVQELASRGFYGSYDIMVGGQNPFDASRSNAVAFYILPPLPVLLSVAGSSLGIPETFARYEIDSPGETLNIAGYGFRSGARLLFDGNTALNGIEIDTKFISSTQLQAYLPPQALRFGGIYTLRVQNISQLPEISGEAITFKVDNLVPNISTISPSPLNIGSGPAAPVSLTINGSNFHPKASGAASQDPGTLVAVTLKTPDVLPALLPVDGLQRCLTVNGTTVLRVRVLTTTGQPAAGAPVTFNAPVPVTNPTNPTGYFVNKGLTSSSGSVITLTADSMGYAPPLGDDSVVFLANQVSGAYIVTAIGTTQAGFPVETDFAITNVDPGFGCMAPPAPQVVFVSSSQLIVNNLTMTKTGIYSVVVANVGPGGGYSEKDLVVTASTTDGTPVVAKLSPSSVPAGTSGFSLTVYRDMSNGVAFDAGAWVNFGTARLNRIAGDTSSDTMTVFVPGFLVGSAGTVPVTVTNPGSSVSTGGTSSRVLFTVTP